MCAALQKTSVTAMDVRQTHVSWNELEWKNTFCVNGP